MGRDYFDVDPRERLFDTPSAVARVVKSTQYERRMVVSAEGSKDLHGKPLTYHWVVLRGDEKKIHIRSLNAAGSKAELRVGYHERRPIAPGSDRESNRVDIGVMVHNGVYYSAPAFVCFYTLDNEKRVYDAQNRIQAVDYTDAAVRDNYVDPLLDFRKDWRDEYHYAGDGKLLGWTRIRGDRREEFTADGRLILANDPQGRPAATCKVRYLAEPAPGGGAAIKEAHEGDSSIGAALLQPLDDAGVGLESGGDGFPRLAIDVVEDGEVQVRSRRIAGVARDRQRLVPFHVLAQFHENSRLLQVPVFGKRAIRVLDDQIVVTWHELLLGAPASESWRRATTLPSSAAHTFVPTGIAQSIAYSFCEPR